MKTKFAAFLLFICIACTTEDEQTVLPTYPGGGDQTPNVPVQPTVPKDTNQTPVPPSTSEEQEVLSSFEQKEFLEEVALEFMENVSSTDFDEISDFVNYVRSTYGDDYDWDNVEDWYEVTFDGLLESLGTVTHESETDYWYGTSYEYNYYYSNYKAILLLSNFTGHFTADDNKWKYSTARDLRFFFHDQNGEECELALEYSGDIKKVYMLSDDDWQDYDYEWITDDYYVSNDYYDRTQYTIGVPERVVVSLTRGREVIVKVKVNTDLSSLQGDRFDISRNNASFTSEVNLNNGYTFMLSQMKYNANSDIALSFDVTKNGSSLATVAVSSEITGIPSCNVDAFSSESFDMDDYETDDANAKNAFVKIDILGKVQIQGKVSNVRKYVDYMDEAYDNDESESSFKSYLNMANGLADINLFYNNSSVKQATVKWEAFVDETYYGYTYWDSELILNFYDGTSYSTFEAFFNDTDFKSVIDSFEELVENYEDLVD